MEIIAYQKFVRTTPRKIRLIADVIRDMHPTDALLQLKFTHKQAAAPLSKVLRQAIANATSNNIEEKTLKFKHILIEEGPRYKRWRAASRGRARSIIKRTSHIKIVLESLEKKEPVAAKPSASAKTETPSKIEKLVKNQKLSLKKAKKETKKSEK